MFFRCLGLHTWDPFVPLDGDRVYWIFRYFLRNVFRLLWTYWKYLSCMNKWRVSDKFLLEFALSDKHPYETWVYSLLISQKRLIKLPSYIVKSLHNLIWRIKMENGLLFYVSNFVSPFAFRIFHRLAFKPIELWSLGYHKCAQFILKIE